MLPVALTSSYVVAVIESVPGGIWTVNVHVYGPLPGHVVLPRTTLNVLGCGLRLAKAANCPDVVRKYVYLPQWCGELDDVAFEHETSHSFAVI